MAEFAKRISSAIGVTTDEIIQAYKIFILDKTSEKSNKYHG